MLLLSNKAKSLILDVRPQSEVETQYGRVCFFSGEACDKLRGLGFLNLVFFNNDGNSYGLKIVDFEESNIQVEGQKKMRRLNSSDIVGLSCLDNMIIVQHWDGFRTKFQADNLKAISQIFTK